MTLLETLVSLSLLAVSVLGVTAVSASGSRLNQTTQEKEAALEALQSALQQIEATAFGQIQATWHGAAFDVIGDGQTNMLEPLAGDPDGQPGSVAVVVPTPPNDPTLLLQVDLRIDWIGVSGPQNLSRSILLSPGGS